MQKFRFVIVTAGGLNGRRLSHLFYRNNIHHELITVSYPLQKRSKTFSLNQYLRNVTSNIVFLRKLKMRNLPSYPLREEFVGRQNGFKMLNKLKEIRPDFIFMMGGGILKDRIIGTAQKGVLNAHPGILPFIRGLDAIKHSILRNIPIGVSGHFIDQGIDTGEIIERYWIPVHPTDTFDDVVDRSDQLSVAVMAKFAFDILEGKNLIGQKQEKKFKLCRKLSCEKSTEAVQKFQSDFYLIHNEAKQSIVGLKSGEDLWKRYNQWWPPSERF